MEELQVTQIWMAGVVLMMLTFGILAITGYLVRRSRTKK